MTDTVVILELGCADLGVGWPGHTLFRNSQLGSKNEMFMDPEDWN